MNFLVDAHNHITTKLPIKSIYNTYKFDQIVNLNTVNKCYYNIGIHPEFICDEVLNAELINSILKNNCINIGEVGLDKRFDNHEQQIYGLKFFFNLAVKNNSSITIHCVKRWGDIINILKTFKDFNLKILFHGYSGSFETVKELLKYNSYFSFSHRELKLDRLIKVIKSIPIDKILIESDMNQIDFNQLGLDRYLDSLMRSYIRLAEILEKPKDIVIKQIENNFVKFTLKDNS